jgi:hypothetical protein
VKDPGEIIRLYEERKRNRGQWITMAEKIRRAYNGEMVIPLPELDAVEAPGIANLVLLGVDQSAMRVASQMPDIGVPPLKPGIELSEEKARQRRLAMLAWWDMNAMQNILRQRARFYLGYGHTPVVVRPVSPKIMDKREIPFWRIYNPFDAYLPRPQFLGDMEPEDGIFVHEQNLAWLTARYPSVMPRLCKGPDPTADTKFEVLEYFDSTDCVLMVIGKPNPVPDARDPYNPMSRPGQTQKGGSAYELLESVPNRAELCPVVAPGRITLDRIKGAFDMIPAMAHKQGRLDALEYISITRGVFPDSWAVTHPTSPTAVNVVKEADGLRGIMGEVQGGQVQMTPINPGVQTPQAIDRLERNQRISAGIPAEYGGESPTNIRTARRGADVLGSTIDMPIGEAQDVFARSLEAENVRAVAIMKAYYGGKKTSFYVPRSGKPLRTDYIPNTAFETDWHTVRYSMPGSDAASIPIELGQRTSTGEMSQQTAREIDPFIEDPIRERDQVDMEGLDRAILGGMEQQLALPAAQGGLDPVTVARIASLRADNPGMYLHDAVIEVHKQMQKEQQAAQQAQGGEPQVPGMGGPPGAGPGPPTALGGGVPGAPPPSAGQPPVPGAPQGQQNLSQIMATLHRPVQQSAPERALSP